MAVGHLYHAMNYGPRVRDYNSTNTEISPQKHEKKKKVFYFFKTKEKQQLVILIEPKKSSKKTFKND